jgi:hypothetical protein
VWLDPEHSSAPLLALPDLTEGTVPTAPATPVSQLFTTAAHIRSEQQEQSTTTAEAPLAAESAPAQVLAPAEPVSANFEVPSSPSDPGIEAVSVSDFVSPTTDLVEAPADTTLTATVAATDLLMIVRSASLPSVPGMP